jgi:hypothetical protein
MKPSIGRIVHYIDDMSKVRAALMLDVKPNHEELEEGNTMRVEYASLVTLKVFTGSGDFVREDVKFTAKEDKGCWFWPPRVE